MLGLVSWRSWSKRHGEISEQCVQVLPLSNSVNCAAANSVWTYRKKQGYQCPLAVAASLSMFHIKWSRFRMNFRHIDFLSLPQKCIDVEYTVVILCVRVFTVAIAVVELRYRPWRACTCACMFMCILTRFLILLSYMMVRFVEDFRRMTSSSQRFTSTMTSLSWAQPYTAAHTAHSTATRLLTQTSK